MVCELVSKFRLHDKTFWFKKIKKNTITSSALKISLGLNVFNFNSNNFQLDKTALLNI